MTFKWIRLFIKWWKQDPIDWFRDFHIGKNKGVWTDANAEKK